MDKNRVFTTMHPDDPKFAEWAQNLLDEEDENTKFVESDDEFEDTIEEVIEEDSDADYSENEDLESESEDLVNNESNFYFGKNKFKW